MTKKHQHWSDPSVPAPKTSKAFTTFALIVLACMFGVWVVNYLTRQYYNQNPVIRIQKELEVKVVKEPVEKIVKETVEVPGPERIVEVEKIVYKDKIVIYEVRVPSKPEIKIVEKVVEKIVYKDRFPALPPTPEGAITGCYDYQLGRWLTPRELSIIYGTRYADYPTGLTPGEIKKLP